ncbi:MAG: hypothetical protein KGR26_11075, partial [Cyanobacteria bacterium REEB65]|nr:hypothetical protein [Cyanobacteria bacterium REEB65]
MIALLCAGMLHMAAAVLPVVGGRLGSPIAQTQVVQPGVLQPPSSLPGPEDPQAFPDWAPSPFPFMAPPPFSTNGHSPSGATASVWGPEPAARTTLAGPGGQTIEIWADRIEAQTEGMILHATGNVMAWYGNYTLTANSLYFDAREERGRARGAVTFVVNGYHLSTDSFDFDILTQQAEATDWSAIAASKGRASGKFLFMSPKYALAKDAQFSPCMADDPGYYLSTDRLQWYPYGGRQHFAGTGIGLHVSGMTVASLPAFDSGFADRDFEEQRRQGGRSFDAHAGYNAYEGAFAAGTGAYALGQAIQGTLPFRITQGRGILLGSQNMAHFGPLSIAGDASYQTPFAGGVYGPRANIGMGWAQPGGPSVSLGAGYRSDVNGLSVDRLGDLNADLGRIPIGPLLLNPTARLGYFWELTSANRLEWWPVSETPRARAAFGSWHATLFAPPWRPNGFWETDAYA